MIAKISVSIVVELGIHTSICAVYGNIHYVATYIIQKFIYGKKSIQPTSRRYQKSTYLREENLESKLIAYWRAFMPTMLTFRMVK